MCSSNIYILSRTQSLTLFKSPLTLVLRSKKIVVVVTVVNLIPDSLQLNEWMNEFLEFKDKVDLELELEFEFDLLHPSRIISVWTAWVIRIAMRVTVWLTWRVGAWSRSVVARASSTRVVGTRRSSSVASSAVVVTKI